MRIGILSDSHGRHEMVRRAMTLFDARKVEQIVHCGDVGGMAVFEEMVGRRCRFVWGNGDTPTPQLRAFLSTVGIKEPNEVPLRFRLAGKRFAVLHGHEAAARHLERLHDVDYVLHGHTHCPGDQRTGHLRVINPGALFRARHKTVAILDPFTDDLMFYTVSSDTA